MSASTLYKTAGVKVKQPEVDPQGCEVLVWDKNGKFYFAVVLNGKIYRILENALDTVVRFLLDTYDAIGFIIDGVVNRVTKNSLQ
jgi:hypothetical protein